MERLIRFSNSCQIGCHLLSLKKEKRNDHEAGKKRAA